MCTTKDLPEREPSKVGANEEVTAVKESVSSEKAEGDVAADKEASNSSTPSSGASRELSGLLSASAVTLLATTAMVLAVFD